MIWHMITVAGNFVFLAFISLDVEKNQNPERMKTSSVASTVPVASKQNVSSSSVFDVSLRSPASSSGAGEC
jgi:hypothetical protein